MNNTRRAILAALAAFTVAAHAAPAPQPVTIVLVHGALIDGSSWRGVHDLLTRHGYPVRVVQQPLTSLDDDVKATQRVLDAIAGPVVLVGHSYGGAVITVAGQADKIKALVYVAALQPDAGETSAEAAPPRPKSGAHLRATPDGFITLAPEHFAADFGADLPKALAAFMADSQMPIAASAFNAKLPVAAWRTKPSYAVIATDDRALAVDTAQRMAARARSKVTLVKASHAVHISQPRAVAQVIEEAAQAVLKAK